MSPRAMWLRASAASSAGVRLTVFGAVAVVGRRAMRDVTSLEGRTPRSSTAPRKAEGGQSSDTRYLDRGMKRPRGTVDTALSRQQGDASALQLTGPPSRPRPSIWLANLVPQREP